MTTRLPGVDMHAVATVLHATVHGLMFRSDQETNLV